MIGLFVAKLDCILMKPSFKILGEELGSELMNYAAFDLYLFHFLIEIAVLRIDILIFGGSACKVASTVRKCFC